MAGSPSPSAGDARAARARAADIVRTLRSAGHEAYFAGGCVRDELLGRTPGDYDVATAARPEVVQALFPRTSAVGVAFGVVLVHDAGAVTEVATFRADGPYSDKRRPDHVEFTHAQADAQRRDFTVNALFLDPLVTERVLVRGRVIRGHVVDHVGGLDDLESGVIRAVGAPAARLAEDHLRAVRAVRFASRLGFTIHEPTAQAIRAHAAGLEGVSRERIGEEVRKMLGDESRALAAWTLQYLGLDEPILGGRHKDPAPQLLGRLAGSPLPYATCLAAWALDRGLVELTQVAGIVEQYRGALCLSNAERDAMKGTLVALASIEHEWASLPIAGQKRLASSEYFTEALRLVSARSPERLVAVRARVDALAATPSGLSPEPLVTGSDLVASGFTPGPKFAMVLAAVYDAQLEDRVATRPAAIALAKALLEEGGG